MTLLDDLKEHAKTTFSSVWTTRQGRVVPDPEDLKLSNDAIEFERATVLYADLSGSTSMVDTYGWQFAAEVYKTYLYCAGKIIRSEDGAITSYDGDRVMAVFIGDNQSTCAVRCALKINWAVQNVVNPALKTQYSDKNYTVSQVVGIDTSGVRAARTGVRGDNDIVLVGRAANYAAKLTEIKQAERTWITKAVYDWMNEEVRMGGNPKTNMWKAYLWSEHDRSQIYGSTYWWSFT